MLCWRDVDEALTYRSPRRSVPGGPTARTPSCALGCPLSQFTEDLVNQDLVNQDLVNQDLVNQDLVNQDLVNQDLVNQDLVNQDLVNPDESLTEHIYLAGSPPKKNLATPPTNITQ